MANRHSRPRAPLQEFRHFVRVVRRLRRECPWDRKQTHRSLRESLIEETYEVVEALDREDLQKLREELGDVLLHVAMHAAIAEEKGEFEFREIIRDITRKLIRRHPHIYGTVRVKSAKEVKHNWEALKMREGRTSLLDGVPRRLPALQRALRVQQRAAKVGFDWKNRDEVWKKVREEVEELRRVLHGVSPRRREEEFGDLLFALVNYARFLDIDPEGALRGCVEKFTERFMHIERQLKERGSSVHRASLGEMDELWNEAKRLPLRRRSSLRA